MGYLYGITTALLFGINPSIIGKLKTKALQQQIATAIGYFFLSLIIFFVTFTQNMHDFQNGNVFKILSISFISGFFMGIGSFLQYKALNYLGTSNGFALSTASILVFNGIFSVLIFQDWKTIGALSLGFGSIFLIIFGAFLVSKAQSNAIEDLNANSKTDKRKKMIIGIIIVILEGLAFSVNTLSPKFLLNDNVSPYTLILPQAVGYVIATFIIAVIIFFIGLSKKQKDPEYKNEVFFDKRTIPATIVGILGCAANLFLIFSNKEIGTAISNSLSQLCVSFSTVLALIILKEYKGKTKKEVILMVLGAFVVAMGGVAIGFTSLLN